MGGASSTLVEQLHTDNEKLQRDLHAQASMLTSEGDGESEADNKDVSMSRQGTRDQGLILL